MFGPYTLCGWRVCSDIDLPELSPWIGPEPAAEEVRVERGAPPGDLPRGGLSRGADGGALFTVAGKASFSISPGAEHVIVRPAEGVDPLDLRGYFYGSVLAMMSYMRGLFPLHASAVALGDSAVAFSGPIGAGKSTLAAALALRGHALLSDDVAVIDLADPLRPMLRPAFPRLKLTGEAVAGLGMERSPVWSLEEERAKGHYPARDYGIRESHKMALPISAIYGLWSGPDEEIQRESYEPKEAAAFLFWQAHRPRLGRILGLRTEIFQRACEVGRAVPTYRMMRPLDLQRIGETAEMLESWHR